jgi:hypothetical protein
LLAERGGEPSAGNVSADPPLEAVIGSMLESGNWKHLVPEHMSEPSLGKVFEHDRRWPNDIDHQ